MGSPRPGAEQSRHLLPRVSTAAHGHPRLGRGRHERGRNGTKAITLLAEAGEEMLVGRRRVRWRGGCTGEVEGVDSEGVDFGDGEWSFFPVLL